MARPRPRPSLDLIAHQLPTHEAAPLAQMLAYAALSQDEPIPPAHDDQPWDSYADACGGLILPTRQSADADGAGTDDSYESEEGGRSAEREDTAAARETPAAWRGWDDAAAVPVRHLAGSSPWLRNSILPLSRQSYLERAARPRPRTCRRWPRWRVLRGRAGLTR
jgi:hypothetical protein